MESIEESEALVRFAIFLATLTAMMLLEAAFPRRPRVASLVRRWSTNLSFAALGAAIVRAMTLAAIPITATAASVWASNNGFGVVNALSLEGPLAIGLSIVVLDFAIWLQHLVTHRVGFLWRLHSVHHVDRDMDASTALRFHPAELGLSMLLKALVVLLLGAPLYAVVLFEVALNGFAIFNHANLRMPRVLDAALRLVLVTPDVHRVHHSTRTEEQNSNYGFSTTLWDRLFRTYRAQASESHQSMPIGLAAHQERESSELIWSLKLPFVRQKRSEESGE